MTLVGLLAVRASAVGWIVAALGTVGICLGEALTGHAGVVARHSSVAVAVDLAHFLGAGGWLGGLAAVLRCGLPVLADLDPNRAARNGSQLVRAYHRAAMECVVLVAITAAIALWIRLDAFERSLDYWLRTGGAIEVLSRRRIAWIRLASLEDRRDAGVGCEHCAAVSAQRGGGVARRCGSRGGHGRSGRDGAARSVIRVPVQRHERRLIPRSGRFDQFWTRIGRIQRNGTECHPDHGQVPGKIRLFILFMRPWRVWSPERRSSRKRKARGARRCDRALNDQCRSVLFSVKFRVRN